MSGTRKIVINQLKEIKEWAEEQRKKCNEMHDGVGSFVHSVLWLGADGAEKYWAVYDKPTPTSPQNDDPEPITGI